MSLADEWIGATEAQLSAKSLSELDVQAVIRFFELAADEPFKATEVVLQVIGQNPKPAVINCLGAGPVEELLVKHPVFLGRLVALAENNDGLAQCLSCVNLPEENAIGIGLLATFLAKKGYE